MRKSWLAILASETGNGTPSGSAPTSAAAWYCDEDAEKWGYSKHKGQDTPASESQSWLDSRLHTDDGWHGEAAFETLPAFSETHQQQMENSCIA